MHIAPTGSSLKPRVGSSRDGGVRMTLAAGAFLVLCPILSCLGAWLELVLDHPRVAKLVLADEIDAEAAGRTFSLDVGDGNAKCLFQHVGVVLEPCGEVEGFVTPHLP